MKMQHDHQLARFIKLCALFSSLFCALFILVYHFFENDVILSLAITAGTTAYHFLMRLAVGWLVAVIARGKSNPNRFWFRQRPFDRRLYRSLRVRRWKDKMPTYDPRKFSLELNTPEEIIQNSCEAELVHEIIIVASFLPILASRLWGALAVFIVTSLLAAGLDCCFVIMQRYNRPRLQHYHNRFNATERRQRS